MTKERAQKELETIKFQLSMSIAGDVSHQLSYTGVYKGHDIYMNIIIPKCKVAGWGKEKRIFRTKIDGKVKDFEEPIDMILEIKKEIGGRRWESL